MNLLINKKECKIMKKILLVCAAGMSTSMLVKKMMEAAKEKDIEVEISALPVSECSKKVDEVDIVLLGPQVRYQKGQVDALVKGRIPVEVIDMLMYGTMNGKAVLENALAKI
jgi:PTS system cellobiose-specific IIB component